MTQEELERLVLKDERLFNLWQRSKLDIEDFIDRELSLIYEIEEDRKKCRKNNAKLVNSSKEAGGTK